MTYTKIIKLEDYYLDENGNIYSYLNNIYKQLKTRINRDGYLDVTIRNKTYTIHSLMAETYLGIRGDFKYIIHIDLDKLNNKLSNLKYSNTKYISGAYVSIPRNKANELYGKKLTYNQADAIRIIYKNSNYSYLDIAKMFSVTRNTIANIINNKTYLSTIL